MTRAHRIRPDQRDSVVAMVVASFREDPQVRWWFPDEAGYQDAAGRFFGVLLDLRVDGGEVWVSDDGASVAMWNPPGGNLIGPEAAEQRYLDVVSALPDPAPTRIRALDEAVHRVVPDEPHWYLGVLATAPSHRGLGLAALVTAPVVDAARRSGVPAVLETATSHNVAYYRRRGFSVCGEVRVADAPTVWVMQRRDLGPDSCHLLDPL
jgi:GNAT superfamily N-acetyltransferase